MNKIIFVIALIVALLAVSFSLLYPDDEVGKSPVPVNIDTAISCINVQPGDNTVEILQSKGFTVDYRDDVWYIDETPVGYAAAEDEPFALCADVELMNKWFN